MQLSHGDNLGNFMVKIDIHDRISKRKFVKNGSLVDRDLLKYWLFPTSSLVNQFVSVHFAGMLDIQ